MTKTIVYIFLVVIVAVIALFTWRLISADKKQIQNPAGMVPVVIVHKPVVQDVEDYYDFIKSET